MKKIIFLGAIFALVFGSFSTVFAADLVSPDKENGNVNIATADSFDNLYTAGGSVNINGETKGDLTTAGGMVNVVGTVEQDALVVGGTINLNGDVYGDVRVLGGNVNVTGNIMGDLVLVGGNVNISENAQIGGDLVLATGNATIAGSVSGNIKVAGGNITINNKVLGSVYAVASDALVFGPSAEVLGRVVFKGSKQAVVSEGAKVPAVEFTQLAKRNVKEKYLAIVSIGFVVELLAWILVGFIFLKYKKNIVNQIVENVQTAPLPTLGWGLVYAVCTPVVILLLLFTVVGYFTAFLLGVGYVGLLAVTGVFSALALGHLVLKYLNKENKEILDWQLVVVGVVVFKLVGLIPVLGPICLTILGLITIGSLVSNLKKQLVNN
jgi:cytoskeletal protein CcmA (bactofilin family)